jgi:hypothetical protein
LAAPAAVAVSKLFLPNRLTLSFEIMFGRPITGTKPELQGRILETYAKLIDDKLFQRIDTQTFKGLTLDNVTGTKIVIEHLIMMQKVNNPHQEHTMFQSSLNCWYKSTLHFSSASPSTGAFVALLRFVRTLGDAALACVAAASFAAAGFGRFAKKRKKCVLVNAAPPSAPNSSSSNSTTLNGTLSFVASTLTPNCSALMHIVTCSLPVMPVALCARKVTHRARILQRFFSLLSP